MKSSHLDGNFQFCFFQMRVEIQSKSQMTVNKGQFQFPLNE